MQDTQVRTDESLETETPRRPDVIKGIEYMRSTGNAVVKFMDEASIAVIRMTKQQLDDSTMFTNIVHSGRTITAELRTPGCDRKTVHSCLFAIVENACRLAPFTHRTPPRDVFVPVNTDTSTRATSKDRKSSRHDRRVALARVIDAGRSLPIRS
jgi:hypothetical protein